MSDIKPKYTERVDYNWMRIDERGEESREEEFKCVHYFYSPSIDTITGETFKVKVMEVVDFVGPGKFTVQVHNGKWNLIALGDHECDSFDLARTIALDRLGVNYE